jgi:hypothetical protein
MKFLFREESIGKILWKKRNKVVKLYFENTMNPFVKKEQSCGISKSDFDIMVMTLIYNKIEF